MRRSLTTALAVGAIAMLTTGPRLAAGEVPPKVPPAVQPFPLEQVRLLPGPFQHAQELDHEYLLSLDPERLLHNFRVNAGLPSSARPLGGWEDPRCELRGHFVGHYLSACALMYAATGDRRLKERADYLVAELAKCQAALKGGYLSAFPETYLDRVETGKPVWAPWYTLHKILAGLLEVYVHCGDAQALEVARKFADWAKARTDRLSDAQMQRMLNTEHGGMNEALANLYGLTGEEKYLALAKRFNHAAVLGPASRREDRLTGLHANTQIPKFIGAAREYELTGSDWLRDAASFFWGDVVGERSYVIGGDSNNEHFTPVDTLSRALGPTTAETCNTYNMLKLTEHLFCWDPRAEYADYYERALYNHILASQNPDSGMMCYYVPLRSGSHKVYNTPLDSFWCCTGTGVENHAKYGEAIYFHDGDKGLWWNLFIPSELAWKDRGLKLRQETAFPDDGRARLVFTCDRPVELSLHIRHPAWATSGMTVSVNGRDEAPESKPGSYVVLTRTWRDGDAVEVRLPLTLRTEAFRDNPRRLAILDGPIVLGAAVAPGKPVPALVAEEGKLLAGIEPVAGKPCTFTGPATKFRTPDDKSDGVTLEPFYKLQGSQPYVVYWDVYTPAQWEARKEKDRAEAAEQRKLEARTVDAVRPNDRRSERDHGLKGERTASGELGGRGWRHATDGGWFSYVVKVTPDEPQELRVTYWGSDGGNRVFDVLVDDTKITTQKLQDNRPDQFYDETYRLPPSLTRGKQTVTVRFAAHPGAWAGGVFGLRVVKAEAAEK